MQRSFHADVLSTYDDTWFLTGNAWHKAVTNGKPPARYGAGLAYTARNRVVLFGGCCVPPQFDDTWTFDGFRWRQQSPAVSPPIREQMGMAYDETAERVILFGGSHQGADQQDTWLWNGTDWNGPSRSHGEAIDSRLC